MLKQSLWIRQEPSQRGIFSVQKVTATRKLTEKQVLTMAADCELGSTHPIAVSIVQEARRQNLTLTRPKEVEEISGKGIRATFPEGTVLLGNYTLMEMYQVDTTGYEKRRLWLRSITGS